jgi:hypothetical protein
MLGWDNDDDPLPERRVPASLARQNAGMNPAGWITLGVAVLVLCVGIAYGTNLFIRGPRDISFTDAGATEAAKNLTLQAEQATSTPQPSPVPSTAPDFTVLPTEVPTAASPSPTPFARSETAWDIQIVDLGPKSGYFTSLAADGKGGEYIAYFNDEYDSLRLAVLNDGLWDYSTLAEGQRQGFYPSAAVDAQGGLHISMYVMDTRQVVYGTASSSGWSWSVVAENVSAADTSLAIDSSGQAHILFLDADTSTIWYAVHQADLWTLSQVGTGIPDGGGEALAVDTANQPHAAYASAEGLVYANLVSGAWQVQVAAAGSQVGLYPALMLDTASRPHLSFTDASANSLKYAVWDGAAWQVSTVDTADAGSYSSIAVDAQGAPRISYYSPAEKALKFAYPSAEGWKTVTVDAHGDAGKYSSLILDGQGRAHISYWAMYDVSYPVLKYADQKSRSALAMAVSSRRGQSFVTWQERTELTGERYRIYRSSIPFTSAILAQASLLAEVGKDSSRFYANRYNPDYSGRWIPRYVDRYIIADHGSQVSQGTGLLVWTLASEDFAGESAGQGYYAVTVVTAAGDEVFDPAYTVGPVEEAVDLPLPVEITHAPGVNVGAGGHAYIQYMDLRHWNATFHAPNASNDYYGLDPVDPTWKATLAYAYDYTIYTPNEEMCGGSLPASLPVFLHLHGYRGNSYWASKSYGDPGCVYGVYPLDESETWYFGFAVRHDYRQDLEVGAGDAIENFTEQRILRMIFDLERQPPGPQVDQQRIYVAGQSMGGSGTLAFTSRFANIFAAGYASQPMTHYLTSGTTRMNWMSQVQVRWGNPMFNLPVVISAPGGWADHLQQFNGTGVYTWQDYLVNISSRYPAEEMAPIGAAHGMNDTVVLWYTQGQPTYAELNRSRRAWAAEITASPHQWEYYQGLPVTLGLVNKQPFWNFQVVLSESVPGISNLSANPALPPAALGAYNQMVMWSSSWNMWDGAPVDQPDRWQVSLCLVAQGARACGAGTEQTADITPRRLQHFTVTPGATYDWVNIRIRDNKVVARGTVTADSFGLVTVPDFVIDPHGSRLVVNPHS